MMYGATSAPITAAASAKLGSEAGHWRKPSPSEMSWLRRVDKIPPDCAKRGSRFMHDGADGPTGDHGGLPWERPVRQVTLAARADVLEQMADPWTKYLHAIDDSATQLQKIWEDVLEKEWKGEAANACYRHWETLVQQIGDYKRHYAPVPGLLKGSASAVTEATHAIPVPVFANNKLPGGFDGNPPDGNAMYDDYQSNRGEYADYAFRKQALDEADQQMSPSGVRVRSGKTYTTGESPGGRRPGRDHRQSAAAPERRRQHLVCPAPGRGEPGARQAGRRVLVHDREAAGWRRVPALHRG